MKERFQKIAALLLIGTMTASLMTGCGGNSGGKEESKETSSEESGSKGEAAEVTLWHYFEHEAGDLEAIAEKYNEEQDDIHVTCTYVSRDELMNQYTIGAVSGELPDIGMVDSPDMASYISLGVFEDITEELEAWEDLEQFYPGPLLSCQDADGKYYGIPNNSNCLALACNMDVLRAAGFENPPTTWDEFRKVCEATTDASTGTYGFAMCAIGTEEGTFQILPWVYSAGGNIDDLSSPEATKGIQFLSDLVKDGLMSKEVVNWQQSEAMNYARARGPHAQWPTLSEAFYTATQQSMLGEKSVEDALKQAADTIAPIVKEDPLPELSIGGGVADDVN